MSKALEPLDFVHGYLNRTEHEPLNGHTPETTACKLPRPSGQEKDSNYRCARCDAERLVTISLIGKIATDTTVEDGTARYAIGKTGFLQLNNGQWTQYDSAFTGPGFFQNPAFEITEP